MYWPLVMVHALGHDHRYTIFRSSRIGFKVALIPRASKQYSGKDVIGSGVTVLCGQYLTRGNGHLCVSISSWAEEVRLGIVQPPQLGATPPHAPGRPQRGGRSVCHATRVHAVPSLPQRILTADYPGDITYY
jgi:hypothetical protein